MQAPRNKTILDAKLLLSFHGHAPHTGGRRHQGGSPTYIVFFQTPALHGNILIHGQKQTELLSCRNTPQEKTVLGILTQGFWETDPSLSWNQRLETDIVLTSVEHKVPHFRKNK